MATIDKTQSQTYNFLSENKSIENIKEQANIEVIEKRRSGDKKNISRWKCWCKNWNRCIEA